MVDNGEAAFHKTILQAFQTQQRGFSVLTRTISNVRTVTYLLLKACIGKYDLCSIFSLVQGGKRESADSSPQYEKKGGLEEQIQIGLYSRLE